MLGVLEPEPRAARFLKSKLVGRGPVNASFLRECRQSPKGIMKMARTGRQTRSAGKEEIDVSAFKDIHIRFPGDVYILAVWLAMSDRSKSTPTCKPHTTLHGLAVHMESLHGTDYSNPLSSEDVMAAFRRHGITGNPLLKLSETDFTPPQHLASSHTIATSRTPDARIAEQI
jgi:hypothetical protein